MAAAVTLPSLPPEFLTDQSRVAEEVIIEPAPATSTRGQGAPGSAGLDFSYDLEAGQAAVLAIRHPSGALTFHAPVQSTSRGLRGPTQVRFQVAVRQRATRGIVGQAVKTIVVKVAKIAVDKAVSFVLPKLVEVFEKGLWKKKELAEGWLKVTQDALKAKDLPKATPSSTERSLLFVHGTFSNAAAA